MTNLANAYKKRMYGDRAKNFEDAANTYSKALEILNADLP